MAAASRDTATGDAAIGADTATFEEAFGGLVDAVSVLQAVRDASGTVVDVDFIYANGPWRRLVLGSADAVLPADARLATFPVFRERIGLYARVLDGGESVRLVAVMPGTDRWYDSQFVRAGDRLIAVSRDVTDAHDAAEALARSEEQLRLVLERTTDVISIVGNDGIIRWVSPSVTRMLGWAPDAWIGHATFEFLHPDDVPSVVETGRGLVAGTPARVTVRMRTVAGEWRWIDVDARPMTDASGAVTGRVTTARDVTDERRVAEALQSSEARYAEMADRVPIGIYIFRNRADGAFGFDYLSPQAERLLGVGSAAAIADPAAVVSMIDPADLPRMLEQSEAMRAAGLPFRWEGGITVGGEVHVIRLSADPMPGADGWTVWHGIVEDVTDRARAEAALASSEAMFRAAFEENPEVIGVFRPVFDETGQYVDSEVRYVNRVGRRLFLSGATLEEIVGSRFFARWPRLRADVFDHHARVAAGRKPVRAEVHTMTPVGERWSELYLFPFADGYVHVSRDVSGAKRAEAALVAREAELNAAQGLAHIGSWTWLPATGTLTWSDELFRIYGLAPGGDPPSFEEQARFVTPELQATRAGRVAAMLSDGETFDIEVDIRRADGEARRIHSHSEPIRDAVGAIVGIRAVVADVTDQRALEDRLRQAQRLEAVGQLAGGIAHDFNNLLAAIRGYNELALDELPAGSPAHEDVEGALAATDRAAALTRQLLAFSRRQALHPEVVDPAAVVGAVIPMLRRLIGEQVELTFAQGVDVGLVRVDPGQLEQLVVNLALNARDAMPGGGRLAIGVSRGVSRDLPGEADGPGTAPRPCVRIAVTDTGTGIDAAVLPHIFEPFFTTKGPTGGSGMGLATVYGIVVASGGAIAAQTTAGSGTTFAIELPRLEASDLPAPVPEPDRRATGGTETILVVEDAADVRSVAVRLLSELGYVVTEADGPAAATALTDDDLRALDVLVTDVVMPGMQGPRLADLLAERRGSSIPTVFISGFAADEALAARLVGPAAAFVAKPFTRAALAAAVARVLGRSDGSSTAS